MEKRIVSAVAAAVMLLLLLTHPATAAPPCNVDTPTGKIGCLTYGSPDPNNESPPESGWESHWDNDVSISPPPTCANYCDPGKECGHIDGNVAAEDAWQKCLGDFLSKSELTSAADRKLAEVFYNAAEVAVRIDVYPQATDKPDEGDAAVAGTIAWAEAQLTGGGLIYLHDGTFNVTTTIRMNIAGTTLRCASGQGELKLTNSANTTILELGHAGAQRQQINVLGCSFNGNSANNTSGIGIHARDLARSTISQVDAGFFDTNALKIDATTSGMVDVQLLDNFLHDTDGATLFVDDAAGACLTDLRISGGIITAGASTANTAHVVDIQCAQGLMFENTHMYGGSGSSHLDCVNITHTNASEIQLRGLQVEGCRNHGIVVDVSNTGGGGQIDDCYVWSVGKQTDATFDALRITGGQFLVSGLKVRSAGSANAGIINDALEIVNGNNNLVSGVLFQANSASDRACKVTAGGTNTLLGCENTQDRTKSVTKLASDKAIYTDGSGFAIATNGTTTILDPLAMLPDGTNGVSVDAAGLMAKTGTGSVRADDVVCVDCIVAGEVQFNYAGSASEGGPATTALAFNANPNNCNAGEWAAGVTAAGVGEGCTPDDDAPEAVDMPLGSEQLTFTIDSDNVGGSEPANGAGFRIRGGSGDVQCIYNATTNILVCTGAAGGYSFDQSLIANLTGNVTGNVTGNLTGNASTASALAANANNCNPGEWAAGVNAAGLAEGCTPDDDAPDAGDYGALTCGIGLNCPSVGTIRTDSLEAGFLADGGTTSLTCSSGQGAGSCQVMDDGTLQCCDGAGTPTLRTFVPGPHTTDTNASTICNGGTTYLDGDGNCDDISSVYAAASHNHNASAITGGTLVHERGGLEADVSAYAGLVRINGGVTSNVTDLAGLNTALGSSIANGPHTTDTNSSTICNGSTTYLDGDGNCDDLSGVYGTVSSVALAVPAEWTISGSPITGSGTLTVGKATQNANLIYGGPTSGGAAVPTFRSLISADLAASTATSKVLIGGASGTNAPTWGAVGPSTIDLTGSYAWTGTHDYGSGVVRVQRGTTVPGTCLESSIFHDTDASYGERLWLCVGTTYVPIDNAFQAQIDGAEINPLFRPPSGTVIDLDFNDAGLYLAHTTNDPGVNGSIAVQSSTGRFRWMGASVLREAWDTKQDTNEIWDGGKAFTLGADMYAINMADGVTAAISNGEDFGAMRFGGDWIYTQGGSSLNMVNAILFDANVGQSSTSSASTTFDFQYGFADRHTAYMDPTTDATVQEVTSFHSAPLTARSGGSGTATITDLTGYRSQGTIGANTAVTTRRGVFIQDLSGSVVTNVGIDIAALAAGTTANIGFRNAATTVFPPPTNQAIGAVGDTISCNATYKRLTTVTGTTTLTSNPSIADGQTGQFCTLQNIDGTTTDCVAITDNNGVQHPGNVTFTICPVGAAAAANRVSSITYYYDGTDWNVDRYTLN